MSFDFSILVLALPLFMFLFLGIAGVKMGKKATGWIGTASMLVTLVICYGIALTYFFGTDQKQVIDGVRQSVLAYDWNWLTFTDKLVVKLGILLDPISAMMLIVISTISFLVHLFSLGYMSDEYGKPEKGFQRYYAFLALFTFSMLGLVVSTNIFQMFIFFEMVGVSSYLLIGFYYTSPAAIHASKKAFIVTRLADLFFLLGVIVISYYTGTLDFFKDSAVMASSRIRTRASLRGHNSFMGCSVMAWAMTFIFIGGAGKSAMYPLHIWLPDAMEGPTPVSALIHAATMVVAGVFLVARMFPVYVLNPAVMNTILVVGAFTAFYAAAVACVQSDIKRALAFSTISQIAYMMTALAVSSNVGEGIHEGGLGYMASHVPPVHSRHVQGFALLVRRLNHSLPSAATRTTRCTACTSTCPSRASASSLAAWPSRASRPLPASSARTRFWWHATRRARCGAYGWQLLPV